MHGLTKRVIILKNHTKLALTVLMIASSAHPALAEGWYGGPFLMGGFTDHDNARRTPTTALPVTSDSDSMLAGGAGLWAGYDFGGWSLELGGSYRSRYDANFSFTDITTITDFGDKSNVQTADLMVSALYDLPLRWKLQPYVGGGVGLAHHMLDNELLTTVITDAGTSSTTNFAWQGQAGLKYPVGETALLRLDYRFTDQGSIETSALPTGTNDQLRADLTSHDLRLGVTWGF